MSIVCMSWRWKFHPPALLDLLKSLIVNDFLWIDLIDLPIIRVYSSMIFLLPTVIGSAVVF